MHAVSNRLIHYFINFPQGNMDTRRTNVGFHTYHYGVEFAGAATVARNATDTEWKFAKRWVSTTTQQIRLSTDLVCLIDWIKRPILSFEIVRPGYKCSPLNLLPAVGEASRRAHNDLKPPIKRTLNQYLCLWPCALSMANDTKQISRSYPESR